MDYFGDVFHTFLGLDSVIYLAVNGTVTSQNILNCVSEDEQSFYGFGTSERVINDKKIFLRWSIPLMFFERSLLFAHQGCIYLIE